MKTLVFLLLAATLSTVIPSSFRRRAAVFKNGELSVSDTSQTQILSKMQDLCEEAKKKAEKAYMGYEHAKVEFAKDKQLNADAEKEAKDALDKAHGEFVEYCAAHL